jgi:hypothetical protein
MLANEKRHEEQGENAKETKTAEVAEFRGMGPGQTKLGERGHMWSDCGPRDGAWGVRPGKRGLEFEPRMRLGLRIF